jgi:hypothetical protein
MAKYLGFSPTPAAKAQVKVLVKKLINFQDAIQRTINAISNMQRQLKAQDVFYGVMPGVVDSVTFMRQAYEIKDLLDELFSGFEKGDYL